MNVDPLGFHNMSRKGGSDSVVFHYDSNKKDKTGENTSPKNCYANPFQPLVCLFLALGCNLCLFQDKFNRKTDFIFRRSGKKGSASDTYTTKALKKIAHLNKERKRIIRQHCRLNHFHPHVTRKGAATHVATGTIDSPPMPSILLHGEWSLGKVLDLYWKWSHKGDYYLGRCLAGLDPDSEEFGVLPPHFSVGTSNEYVTEALEMCFGVIIIRWANTCAIEGALLLFLAKV